MIIQAPDKQLLVQSDAGGPLVSARDGPFDLLGVLGHDSCGDLVSF